MLKIPILGSTLLRISWIDFMIPSITRLKWNRVISQEWTEPWTIKVENRSRRSNGKVKQPVRTSECNDKLTDMICVKIVKYQRIAHFLSISCCNSQSHPQNDTMEPWVWGQFGLHIELQKCKQIKHIKINNNNMTHCWILYENSVPESVSFD